MATQAERTFSFSTVTAGDTSTPSVIKIQCLKGGKAIPNEVFGVRARVCNSGLYADSTNATIAPTAGYGTTVETHTSTKDLSLVSQAGVSATETLTISGVVIEAETATIGTRVYEFDTDGSVTGSNVAVDISASATAAQATLTIDVQVTAGDTMTIGPRTYAFVADGTANMDGEIDVGSDEADGKIDIVAAINGTDGWNTANTVATAAAFSGDDCVLTAIISGTAGDALVSTETFTAAGSVFDATTFGTTTAGVDCTAANAVTALVAAITADVSRVVSAADGTGDTVDVTAVTAGTAGNALASTETMANGAWGDTTLSGGTDDLGGEIRVTLTDATAETVTLRLGSSSLVSMPAEHTAALNVTHAAP